MLQWDFFSTETKKHYKEFYGEQMWFKMNNEFHTKNYESINDINKIFCNILLFKNYSCANDLKLK
jgi:hypothetical protein